MVTSYKKARAQTRFKTVFKKNKQTVYKKKKEKDYRYQRVRIRNLERSEPLEVTAVVRKEMVCRNRIIPRKHSPVRT